MAINDKADTIFSMLRDPEEDLADAFTAYVWAYYRNYCDATELEPQIVGAMRTLLDGLDAGGGDLAEELVVRAERDINALGGVVGSDGGRHRVDTFPGYVLDDDEDDE